MKLVLVADDGTVVDTWQRASGEAEGEWLDTAGDWAFMDSALPGDIQRQIFYGPTAEQAKP